VRPSALSYKFPCYVTFVATDSIRSVALRSPASDRLVLSDAYRREVMIYVLTG